MRVLFALYNNEDEFIDCSYNQNDLVKYITRYMARRRGNKMRAGEIYAIPLEPQDDVFKEADERFLREEGDKAYYDKEIAEREGITLRTLYRRRAKLLKENGNE